MTLILNATHPDFVLFTSDSRMVKSKEGQGKRVVSNLDQWIRKAERAGEREYAEKFKNLRKKVYPVTDRVLFSMSGKVGIGSLVKEELLKRVSEDDDLQQCSLLTEQILNELSAGAPLHDEGESSFDELINSVSSKTIIRMSGFDKNDLQGVTVFFIGSDGWTKEELQMKDQIIYGGSFPAGLPGMTDNALSVLNSEAGGTKMQQAVRGLVKLHAMISYVAPEVCSSDCHVNLIIKKDGQYEQIYSVFETSDYYKDLPDEESVKLFLYGRDKS